MRFRVLGPLERRSGGAGGLVLVTAALLATAACSDHSSSEAAATEQPPTASTDQALTSPISLTVPPTTSDAPTTSVPPTSTAETVEELQHAVERAVAEAPSIPGILLHVAAPTRGIDASVAAGVADRASGAPLQSDASFRIASNTKTYTAAAVLRLVEDGQIGLDDPVTEHLRPETLEVLVAGGYAVDDMTVRQLLLHTSGLPDHSAVETYQAQVVGDPAHHWTRLEQVQFAVGLGEPLAAPGALFSYSDTGYVLLGEIIESASGMPLAEAYPTLLEFPRLGLDETYLEPTDGQPSGVADRSHQYFDDTDTYGFDPSFDLYGGGGLVATAEDLATFLRALLHGDVFKNPATLDTMLDVSAVSGDDGGAMGIFRVDVVGHTCWYHTGFWGSIAISCPDIDVTVAASIGQAHADDYDPDVLLQQAFMLAGVALGEG